MHTVLNKLVQHSQMPLEIREKVEPGRKADTAITRANPAKLVAATGWEPQYSLDQTLCDVFAFWRGVPQSTSSK